MKKETEKQVGKLQWTALRRDQALELQESGVEVFCKIECRNDELLWPVIFYTASDKMTYESVTYAYNTGCHISIETTDYHQIFGIFKEDTKTANRSVDLEPRGLEAPAQPASPQGPSVPEPRVQLLHEECTEIYNNSLPLNLQVALSPTGDLVNARWINWPHMYEILEDCTPHLYIEADDYREFKRLKNANIKLNLTLAKHELLQVLLRYEESLNRTELAGKVQELCQAINAILPG